MSAFQTSKPRTRTHSSQELARVGVSLMLTVLVDVLVVGVATFVAARNPLEGAAAINVVVTPGPNQTTFTASDSDALVQQVDGVASATPVVSGREGISATVLSQQMTVLGVDPDFLAIQAWQVDQGAVFTEQDNTAFNRVAVLGET